MRASTIGIVIFAICSCVFYYKKTQTQINDLQHEVEIMENDQLDYTRHIAHLTGLLQRNHINYGERNAKRK
jgi:hypothetical protein